MMLSSGRLTTMHLVHVQDDWAKARSALKLDDRMGVIQARDLSKHTITSAADGLDLVRRATANRRVGATGYRPGDFMFGRARRSCLFFLAFSNIEVASFFFFVVYE